MSDVSQFLPHSVSQTRSETRSSPWLIRAEDFPEDGDFSDQMRFLIGYAILAPSTHNAQPWRFLVGAGFVAVYADWARALPHVDPDGRELIISCGCVLETLSLALRRFGFSHNVVLATDGDDPGLVARLVVTGKRAPCPEDRMLFAAIQARRTTRKVFDDLIPPRAAQDAWCRVVSEFDVSLHLTADETHRLALAELTGTADRAQFADPGFREELSQWIHRVGTGDGLSAGGYPGAALLAPVEALVVRNIDVGRGVAARDRQLASHTPLFGLVSTAHDRQADWIAAGRALAVLLLSVTAWGATAAFLNQAIEVQDLRDRVRTIGSGVPQILLRLGYGPAVRPSARRAVGDVLMERPPSV